MNSRHSLSKPECSKIIEISSDEEDIIEDNESEVYNTHLSSGEEEEFTSLLDGEQLPKVSLCNISNNLFSANTSNDKSLKKPQKESLFPICPDFDDNDHNTTISKRKLHVIKKLFPFHTEKNVYKPEPPPKGESSTCELMIAGVNVKLPVKPYPSQIALMSNLITSIKESKNCILESPTGSGKTLALLCGVLAWQQREKEEQERKKTELLQNIHMASPLSSKPDVTPEKIFSKPNFGEKSIYQKTEEKIEESTSNQKRPGPYMDESPENAISVEGLVSIHKKARHLDPDDVSPVDPTQQQVTPKKLIQTDNKENPESIRVPTIYYGARTHTQLQQVIREFKRTAYCGLAKMSLLSSRDKSCIRNFERDRWSSRDDMCRACVKPINNQKTNCVYYDNRWALKHKSLPDAFDLEDLVKAGNEKQACPYFGARNLVKTADIIFCPYNYLIDPIIRSSMQINLQDSIVLIDEAHNIENNCRDAASYSLTQVHVRLALKELQHVAGYRFSLRDLEKYIDSLIKSLKSWDDWFTNQIPLLTAQVPTNKKVAHNWEVKHFVQTLENHNIGFSGFSSFRLNSETLCRRIRDDPRTLLGVTQTTTSLLEALCTVLGYLFRDDHKYMDDFKPVLEGNLHDEKRDRDRSVDSLTLHLHCLNPAIVMSSLQVAQCIALASGTLTPMISIHAELGTPFPRKTSPLCGMPKDRVWIGIVKGEEGSLQEYKHSDLQNTSTWDKFGELTARVCEVTPHGVLCFVNSYATLHKFIKRWKLTGLWKKLMDLKHLFLEQRTAVEHEEMMKEFYECVGTSKGALLLAVYRGKVSEGMDFKDHQARAVICMGIPYPNMFETAIKAKIAYNDKYKIRGLLGKEQWIQVQAYRALNQALGRCVRHKKDWGAVLLVDNRYTNTRHTEHLSKWVNEIINHNPYTHESLISRSDGLAAFMERMKIEEEENAVK